MIYSVHDLGVGEIYYQNLDELKIQLTEMLKEATADRKYKFKLLKKIEKEFKDFRFVYDGGMLMNYSCTDVDLDPTEITQEIKENSRAAVSKDIYKDQYGTFDPRSATIKIPDISLLEEIENTDSDKSVLK